MLQFVIAMNFIIDWATWQNLFYQSPGLLLWHFFVTIGWIPLAIMFLFAARVLWLFDKQSKWSKTIKFVLLAIDLPSNNEQSPKAVENMFSYLAGAHGTQNFFEKWFLGEYQLSFSYEIVSIEGYTQFLIRTPVMFRNLVESSIYSQYPDAEIVEVDDYTIGAPRKFPDEEYDVWGTEFIQAATEIFPIKTYTEFEHQFGPSETQFKDPMASLMDLCSSLRAGEQLWYQILVIPTGFDWMTKADDESNKILGKLKKDVSLGSRITDSILKLIDAGSEAVYSLWGDIEESEKKEDKPRSMLDLTPKEKNQMEGVYHKASKLAFKAKVRVVYLARKDVMNKAKVANGIVGYMKQFSALDLNNFKPDLDYTMTRTAYFMKESRLNTKKAKIINNYIRRDSTGGRTAGLFTIDELATIWHFPIEANVRAPMIQKASGRKGGAPSTLPISEEITDDAQDLLFAPDNVETELAVTNFENLEEETPISKFGDQADQNSDDKDFFENKSGRVTQAKTGIDTKASPPLNLPTA